MNVIPNITLRIKNVKNVVLSVTTVPLMLILVLHVVQFHISIVILV